MSVEEFERHLADMGQAFLLKTIVKRQARAWWRKVNAPIWPETRAGLASGSLKRRKPMRHQRHTSAVNGRYVSVTPCRKAGRYTNYMVIMVQMDME